MSFVSALIVAWLLSLFGFDTVFVNGVSELFGINISTAGYYVIFFLVGLCVDLFGRTK